MATREADRRRLRADAQSELELALAVIAEIRSIDLNKIHDHTQGYDDPHAYAGFPARDGLEVKFEYEDESGKLPLSVLTKNDLIQLLYSLGMEQRDAERVADAIIFVGLVAHERHVGHDQATRRAALHGGGESDQEIKRRVQRVRVTEDDFGRSVANKKDRNARAFEPARSGGVVAGECGEWLLFAHRP